MKNLKEKAGLLFGFICLVSIVILCLFIYPYKETLECKGNDCSVKKSFVFNFKNYTYSFNRSDNLEIYHRARKHNRYTVIQNQSDYDTNIFRNNFTYYTAQKVINVIKSEKQYIKITKYWLGYKIEK